MRLYIISLLFVLAIVSPYVNADGCDDLTKRAFSLPPSSSSDKCPHFLHLLAFPLFLRSLDPFSCLFPASELIADIYSCLLDSTKLDNLFLPFIEFLAQSSFRNTWIQYNQSLPTCLKQGYLAPNVTGAPFPDFDVFCQNPHALYYPCSQAGGIYAQTTLHISALESGKSTEWVFTTSACTPSSCSPRGLLSLATFVAWQIPLVESFFRPPSAWGSYSGWGYILYYKPPFAGQKPELLFKQDFVAKSRK
jgi:hypothetical protein